MSLTKFQKSILNWYHKNGRKNLPWQQNISAYTVWISEIMLQQTQVVTVIPYYERFMSSFPTVRDLAEAAQDVVMEHWAGLGYYSRARNLHQTAKIIISEFQGIFPNEIDDLVKLPGIGRTTAGAIKSLAFNQRGPILDGNVKRVLSRYHKIEGWSGSSKTNQTLWFYADKHTPNTNVREYTQAIMDIGATVCKKNNPYCTSCPIHEKCKAFMENEVLCYPAKKPHRKIQEKSCYFLIIKDKNSNIFLEKNRHKGIWQDLWLFPKCTEFEDMKQICASRGLKIKTFEILKRQTHTFSHFKLLYTPIIIEVSVKEQIENNSQDSVWYTSNNKLKLGVPAPVKSLLNTAGNILYFSEVQNG